MKPLGIFSKIPHQNTHHIFTSRKEYLMAVNKALLQAGHTVASDECMTPFYAVEPLLTYIPKNKTIWCPFDKEWSAFVQLLQKQNNVIHSHADEGKDFFKYTPDHFDMIVSNPPFSCKDRILQRCYELNKPFALLLPVNCIQGKKRVEMFMRGNLQLLAFDLRIDYHINGNMDTTTKGTCFGSAFFCKDILPQSLVFAPLKKYEKSLGDRAKTHEQEARNPSQASLFNE